mmetsp:Transcript_60164/g.113522  ORF Transcript_60164/g.113522 Transcript_60164/m.113522 type:complete len:141 (-) Transcript_60164:506-928(-)
MSSLPDKRKSRAAKEQVEDDGPQEQDQEIRVKKFDMGIFFLVAESFGDATYSNLAKTLMQRSPPTSALRSAHVQLQGKKTEGGKPQKKGWRGRSIKTCDVSSSRVGRVWSSLLGSFYFQIANRTGQGKLHSTIGPFQNFR